MKIKIKLINKQSNPPKFFKKGEWIDLRASENVEFKSPRAETLKRVSTKSGEERYRQVTFDNKMIPLGIATKLPKGYEAVVLPRSSTFKAFGIILANSQGIIDNSYSGNEDEWKFHAIALNKGKVFEGERICQFRIQLSQKATMWQKIKWLFSSKIKIEYVNNLDLKNRGGFGSTGKD